VFGQKERLERKTENLTFHRRKKTMTKQENKGMKRKLGRLAALLLMVSTLTIGMVQPAAARSSRATTSVATDSGRYRLPGNYTHTFTRFLAAGEVTSVYVEGDGTTDLDIYVYDPYGRLVTKDDDNSDVCVVNFTAWARGNYTFRLVNRGAVYNDYDIYFDYQ